MPDLECGDSGAVTGEVEKACWEGRLLDKDRRAVPDGRKGISFVAIGEAIEPLKEKQSFIPWSREQSS